MQQAFSQDFAKAKADQEPVPFHLERTCDDIGREEYLKEQGA